MRTALALFVLILFPGVVLDGIWLRGEVHYAAGVVEANDLPWYRMQPAGSTQAKNPLLSDMVYQFLPWDGVARRFWQEGIHPPLWNPLGGAGVPLLANPQAGVLDPVRLAGLCLNARFAPALRAWVRLALAGLFCFGLLRHLGARRIPSLTGAAAYQLGGFMIPWLAHPHSGCALFFPALLWAGDALLRSGGPRPFCALALAFGLQFLAGHPETGLHMVILAGLFWLLNRTGAGWRSWFKVGLALLTGLLLAAPLLVPFLEYLVQSAGFLSRTAGPAESLIPASGAATFLVPRIFGWPLDGVWSGPLNANEVVAYIGVIPWLLAPVACLNPLHRRPAIAFGVILAFSAAAIYGVPGLREVLEALPVFGWGSTRRLILGVVLAGAVLGGLGLDVLMRDAAAPGARAWWGSAAAAAAGLIGCLAGVRALAEPWSAFRACPLGWCLFLGQATLVLILIRFILVKRLNPRWAWVFLPLLVTDLGYQWRGYQPTAPAAEVMATTPAIEAMVARARPGDRTLALPIRGREKLFPPNTLQAYGISDIRNFDVLEIPCYRDLHQRLLNHPSMDRFCGPEANLLGARFLASSVPLECVPSACRLFSGQEHAFLLPEVGTVRQLEVLSYLVTGETLAQDEPVAEVKVLVRATGKEDGVHTFTLRAGRETADWAIPQLKSRVAHRVAVLARVFTVRDGSGRPYPRYVYRHRFPWRQEWGRPMGASIRFTGRCGFLEVDGVGVVDEAGRASLEPRRQPFFRGEILLYENEQALPRAFLIPAGQVRDEASRTGVPRRQDVRPARIVEVAADRILVTGEALEDEILVLTDTWFPGWKAELDSGSGPRQVPMSRVFTAFRAVRLPPGAFSLTFQYRPDSFLWGLVALGLGVCILLSSFVVRKLFRSVQA